MKLNFTVDLFFGGIKRLSVLALIVSAISAGAQTPVFDKMNATTTPTGAYSLRKLNSSVTNTKVIHVKNWDGNEADINFSAGVLDQAALTTLTNSYILPGSSSNPIDLLSGAPFPMEKNAIYSLRPMTSTYVGSAIRVRRTDGMQQDIGFSGGDLNVAALLTFVGSGPTDNGFVTVWYDQGGTGYNAIQATPAKQPQIVAGGIVLTRNGKTTMTFTLGQYFEASITPSGGAFNAITGNAVASMTNGNDYGRLISIFDPAAASGLDYDNPTSIDLLSRAGNTPTDQTIGTYFNDPTTANNVIQPIPEYDAGAYPNHPSSFVATTIYNGAGNATVHVNGDAFTPAVTNPLGTPIIGGSLFKLSIGAYNNTLNGWGSNISEVTVFFSALNNADRGFLEGSQLKYYGIGNNGFVSAWYDQSGAGNDLLQSTPAKQPQIVTNGVIALQGGKPTIPFTGYESLEAPITVAGPITDITGNAVGVLNSTTTKSFGRVLSFLGPAAGPNDYDDPASADLIGADGSLTTLLSAFNNGTFNSSAVVGSSPFVASSVINSSTSTLYVNGTGTVQTAAGAAFNGASFLTVGNDKSSDFTYQWGGSISEVVLFASVLKTEDRWVLEANQADYYSVSPWNGAFAWEGGTSNVPTLPANWLPSLSSITSTTDVVIPRNVQTPILITANTSVRNWGMVVGSTSTINSPRTLNISNNIFGGGTLTGLGSIKFLGTVAQTITSTVISLTNFSLTNTSAQLVNNGDVSITGILQLSAGATMDADGTTGTGLFTLKSTPTSDAMVALLTGTNPISGNVIVERYLPSATPSRTYRYLAPQVKNATVADWKLRFPITGTFSDPSITSEWSLGTIVSGNPSLFVYNEAHSGSTTKEDRYEAYPLTSSAASIVNGVGYAAFIRDISPINIVLKGPIAQGNVTVPVTNTPSGVPANDGYNLIGNPYPTPISWAQVIIPAEIDDVIYARDNANNYGVLGGYATFIQGTGVGSPVSFDGTLAMGQAFFVHASTNGSMIFHETDKITLNSAPTFIRQATVNSILRLSISGNSTKDETVIYFPDDAIDVAESRFDAVKFKNSNARALNFSSLSSDGKLMVINGLASVKPGTDKTVKLAIEGATAGTYEIKAGQLETFDNSETTIELTDKFTGTLYTFDPTHLIYNFSVTSEAASSASDRFTLKFTRKQTITAVEDINYQFLTYPNPTKNIVYVEAPLAQSTEVKVISSMGIVIGTVNLTNQDGRLKGQFDLSDRPVGMYLINLSQGGKIVSKKVVKK